MAQRSSGDRRSEDGASPPSLLVTVDVEEEGVWRRPFRPHGNTVENTRGLERFQRCCDRFGVAPTYLVDTPVVEDDRSVGMLRRIRDAGRCEIGAHIHPWCSPPLEGPLTEDASFLCNLPEDLQRRKVHQLTERIEARFGQRPISFRAGRFGLNAISARILATLGYRVDSSVIPFFDYSDRGRGPDYRRAPWTPYRITDESGGAGRASTLLEVPVSVGFNRRRFRDAQRVRQLAMRQPLRALRTVGILDRLGIVRRIKFSPEQANAADMKTLIDRYVRQRAPCMVMTLHSSSLLVGYSPYAPDAARLERLYADLEETLAYARGAYGMVGRTLEQFAALSAS